MSGTSVVYAKRNTETLKYSTKYVCTHVHCILYSCPLHTVLRYMWWSCGLASIHVTLYICTYANNDHFWHHSIHAPPTTGTTHYGHHPLRVLPTMGTTHYGHHPLQAPPTTGTTHYRLHPLQAPPTTGSTHYRHHSLLVQLIPNTTYSWHKSLPAPLPSQNHSLPAPLHPSTTPPAPLTPSCGPPCSPKCGQSKSIEETFQ